MTDEQLAETAQPFEALEASREQVADLLELVEVERERCRALRAAVQQEIDAAYQVGANYVSCQSLRRLLVLTTPPGEGVRRG